MSQLCSAVGYLHSMGVVHGHLSPDHIIICKSENFCVKILNMFIPKVQRVGGQNNFRGGNPVYWSPEQGSCYDRLVENFEDISSPDFAAGHDCKDLGVSTDLYSLGLIFIELCYGKRFWCIGSSPSLIVELTARYDKAKVTVDRDLKIGTSNFIIFVDIIQKLLIPDQRRQYDTIGCISDLIEARNQIFNKTKKAVKDMGSTVPSVQADYWLDFFDPNKSENLIKIYNNLGIGFYLMDMPNQAYKFLSKAIELNRIADFPDEIVLFNYSSFGAPTNNLNEVYSMKS